MADVSGILAAGQTTQQQPNMLDQIVKFQALKNAQAQNALIQQSTANATTTGAQLKQTLASSNNSAIASDAYALSLLPQDQQTPANYRAAVDRQVALGRADPQSANVWKAQITDDMTPQQLQIMGLQHGMALMNPQIAQQMAGSQGFMTNGQQSFPMTRPGIGMPNAGAIQYNGPGVQQLPAPAWQTNYNPADRTTTQVPSPSIGGGTNAPSIPGNGGYPGKGAAPATASNGPAFNTSAPIGTPEQVNQNITAYNSDASKVPDTMDAMRDNTMALQALQIAHTGRGTQAWNHLGQVLQSWGVVPDGSEWASHINSQAEAEKLTSAAILNNPHVHSDASLDLAAKANPTTGIPNEVAQQIIQRNIAQQRMAVAQVSEAPADRSTYLTHAGQYPLANDRRAYAWDTYTPEQQAAIKTELAKSPDKQKAFARTLGVASRLFGFQPNATAPAQ